MIYRLKDKESVEFSNFLAVLEENNCKTAMKILRNEQQNDKGETISTYISLF